MNSSKQTGLALATTLIFLTVMMIFAVTALRTSTLDERLAANYQFSTVTDQAAEVAVSEVLRDYQKDIDAKNADHIFKQVWDDATRKKYFPDDYRDLNKLVTDLSAANSNATYRSEVLWKNDRYQRSGDDLRFKSMLYYVEGEAKYEDRVGAKAKHRVGISVPRANIKGFESLTTTQF